MRTAWGITVALAMLGPARADDAAAAAKVQLTIGHRGSKLDRPENTLASFRRAIEAGVTATELDARTTKDGVLICRHDADLKHASNGSGLVGDKTLAEIKQLDAGSWFDPKFKDERIPTLEEALKLCKGKIHVMIDLKEDGPEYIEKIVALVRQHGNPKEIILGIRSVEQAKQFRKRLPEARQIGLIPKPEAMADFAAAGVEIIRLWPYWLEHVPAVRKLKLGLHLDAGKGTAEEVRKVLAYEPASLSSDDPATLTKTLAALKTKN